MGVAVIITCLNEGSYVKAALQSVLDQTASHLIECIIISDDGSNKDTLDVLAGLERLDARIQVFYNDKHIHGHKQGLARNRNRAVSNTSSPYLAFLDADDIWHKAKIEKQFAVMDADPQTAVVYTSFQLFKDSDPNYLEIGFVRDLSQSKDQVRDYFLRDPPIVPSTVLLRRSVFEHVGGFDENIPVFEDTDFFFRCARRGTLTAIGDVLVQKRVHSRSITSQRQKMMEHHTSVALHIVDQEPRLLPLIGKRLAERAAKLGNAEALDGNMETARSFYLTAIKMNPFQVAPWITLAAIQFKWSPLLRIAKRTFQSWRMQKTKQGREMI